MWDEEQVVGSMVVIMAESSENTRVKETIIIHVVTTHILVFPARDLSPPQSLND